MRTWIKWSGWKWRKSNKHKIKRVCLQLEYLEDRQAPAVYTVINPGNAGVGLGNTGDIKYCIDQSNQNPGVGGPNVIDFNIPGLGPHVIQPADSLTITSPVTINGYSQPGTTFNTLVNGDNATLQIVFDGANKVADCFQIQTTDTTIRGLDIYGFRTTAITISGTHEGPQNNQIQGNFIGVDVTGTKAVPNGTGIYLNNGAIGNTIGGTARAYRNIISGSKLAVSLPTSNGIELVAGSNDNTIQGNYIGTDRTGTVAIANFGNGIIIKDGSSNTIGGSLPGAGNLISGNEEAGIAIVSDSEQSEFLNTIQQNLIGTDCTGLNRISNRVGILIVDVSFTFIGGNAPSMRNVVSGNSVNIKILGEGAVSNVISGNYIGTDITGGAKLSTSGGGTGVVINGIGNIVGGTDPGDRNIISGLGTGVEIASGGYNLIQGNYIGLDSTGTKKIGNWGNGITVNGGLNTLIGGTEAGAGNVISGNGTGEAEQRPGSGVELRGGNATQIEGNMIGTDKTGKIDIGNNLQGIDVGPLAEDTVIGGTVPAAENIISGNRKKAIEDDGKRTKKLNNKIGKNAGDAALPVPPNNDKRFVGVLDVGLGGPVPGKDYIQLAVNGTAFLSGTLNVSDLGGFVPLLGQTFTILAANAITGDFTTVNGLIYNLSGPNRFDIVYTSTAVELVVVPNSIPSAPTMSGLSLYTLTTKGSTNSGNTVTLTGNNFSSVTSVTFDGVPALSFTVLDPNHIIAYAPPHPITTSAKNVQVTTVGGNGSIGGFNYITDSAPTVTGLSQTSDYTFGDDTITITGTNFIGATEVDFGTVASPYFKVISDTQIQAIVPAHDAATGIHVTVTTFSGTSTTGPANAIDFITEPAPAVTNVNPSNGSTAGGTSVTISGSNFVGITNVLFGGIEATSFTVTGSGSITAVAPPNAAGTVDLSVVGFYGESAANSSDQFTYTVASAPTISSVNTSNGSAAGDVVTISGSNFFGTIAVSFGNVAATDFTVNSYGTAITATVPTQAPATVNLNVTTYAGTADNSFSYTASPAPTMTGLTPASGSANGGSEVRIYGTNFTWVTDVTFDGIPADSFEIESDNLITAIAPPHAPAGSVPVVVSTFGASSSPANFAYLADTAPAITGLSDTSGPITGGKLVTILGTNFGGATAVKFGSTVANWFVVSSDTSITALAPSAAATGTIDLTVTTNSGTSTTGTPDQFTYSSVAAPTITSITTNTSGSTKGGATVTINGSGFDSASEVDFGGVPVDDFIVNSSSQITAVAPAHNAGNWDITVTTPGGASALSSNDRFTYTTASAPAVTGVTQLDSGSLTTAGGNLIEITGTDFTSANRVRFGDTDADFTVLSDTAILTTSPPHAAGTVYITVTTFSGTSQSTSSDNFTYTAASTPSISSLSPTSGDTTGDTVVDINGSNFLGASGVTFDGVEAAFTVVSDSLILATAPPHATTGTGHISVIVKTEAGSSSTGSSSNFSYAAPSGSTPSIAQVTPNTGSTAGGDVVTIVGSNFVGVTEVDFGTVVTDAFTVNSDTSITVTAPPNNFISSYVHLVVKTTSGQSPTGGTDHFTYNASSGTATVTGVSPATGTKNGGTTVTITGTYLSSASSVSFGGTAGTIVGILSEAAILVTAPSVSTAGAIDVTVTTANNTSATNPPGDTFTFESAADPTVGSVSGGPISTAGGNTLTLTGNSFTSASAVFIGTTPAASFTVSSGTSITLVTSALPADVYDITVTTPSGTSAAGSGDLVTCTAASTPTVTGISYSGTHTTAGGTDVTISGTYFTGAVSVTFGDVPASFTVTNSTTIHATSPAQWAGTVDVRVTTYAGTTATNSSDNFTYTVNSAPSVSNLGSTTSGTTAGGTSVTINGSHLIDAYSVMFGDTPASSFTVNNDNLITAVAPPHATGVVDVIVSTYSGTSVTSSSDQFTYSAATAPAVTSVSPSSGSTAGNTQVTITGTDFTGTTGVVFGSVAATDFSVDSTGTHITVTAPAQDPATNLDVRVTTYAGTSPTTSNDYFTYNAASAPTVTGFDRSSSPTAGGVVVTVIGTNFTGATAVTFDGTSAAFTVISDTALVATTPAHAATSGIYVRVATHSGTSSTGGSSSFSYSDPSVNLPTVSSLTTSSGTTAGGTVVTLTGSYLGDVTGLSFGDTPVTLFAVNSDSQVTAVTPPHIAGTYDISMTIPGQSTPIMVARFSFSAASAPMVTNVTHPGTATTVGGTPVTLTGTDFTGASVVTFDGIPASFTVYFSTTIVAISPPHAAGTVDINVTTPTGTSATTGYDQFTYSSGTSPSITTISPNSASTSGGDVVSIIGSHFADALAVTFDTTDAEFTILSDTLIFATVPPHASGSGISVTVTNETGASSPATFTYSAATGPSVSKIGPATGATDGGTLVTLVGSHFTGASAVRFGSDDATDFTVLSDTTILATAPAKDGVTSPYITVVTPTGTSSTSSSNQYTYADVSLPQITSLGSLFDSTAGGSTLTINGSNFGSATKVWFGTQAVTPSSVGSSTITVTVPSTTSAQTVDIAVQTPDGLSPIVPADRFTYVGSVIRTGFTNNQLVPGDDGGSPAAVSLGFSVTFFGNTYSSVYINDNGNLTFGSPLSTYTPFSMASSTVPIIAPFFADIDTHATSPISYGTGTVGGQSAFAVTWSDAGYYAAQADRTNTFQVVLVQDPYGGFDIELNYQHIGWESGDANGGTDGLGGIPARMGYSAGTGVAGTYAELSASGQNGYPLDTDTTGHALYNHDLNSSTLGRYVFPIITLNWTGGGSSNDWSDQYNWSSSPDNLHVAPVNGDNLIFGSAGISRPAPNDNIAGLTVNSVTISNTGYTIGGNAGVTLGLSGNVDNTTGASTISVPVALTSDARSFIVASGTTLTLSGVVGGSGYGPDIAGGGTVILATNPTFTGTAIVDGNTTMLSISSVGNVFSSGSVTLQNGGTLQLNGTSTIYPGSGHTLTIGTGGGTVDVEIPQGGKDWLDNGNYFYLQAPNFLQGSGTLTKTGTGQIVTDNSYSSLFTGDIVVDNGYFTIKGGTNVSSSAITVNSGGILDLLNGDNPLPNNVTLNNGGKLSAELGDRTLTGTLTLPNGTNSTISLADTFSASTSHNITLSGQVTGGGNLTISAPQPNSLLTLTNITNGQTGIWQVNTNAQLISRPSTGVGSTLGSAPITLNGGDLYLKDDGPYGSGSTMTYHDSVTVSSTSKIDVNNATVPNTGGTFVLDALTTGSQLNVTGDNGYSLAFPTVSLTNDATFNPTTANLTLSSISGSYSVTKSSGGTLTLTGSYTNTFGGSTTIQAGVLAAANYDVLNASHALTVNQGAVLDLNGNNNTIGSLSGAGIVRTGTGTLTTGNDNSSTTFSGVIDDGILPSGFYSGEMDLNGSATMNGTAIRLVPAANNQQGSAFTPSTVNISSFHTSFNFLFSGGTSPKADGLTFTIQNNSPSALGANGGGEGYQGIPNSIAIKFDAYHNSIGGMTPTGGRTDLYTDGANPGVGGADIVPYGSVPDLQSGDPMRVDMNYDGATLVWTITDTITNATFTSDVTGLSIPSIVGSSTAYVGFTGGTGAYDMNIDVQKWSYASGLTTLSNGLNKTGTGTQTLSGAAAYVGTATVSNGTLAGTGTIAGALAVNGGTVSPGIGIGIQARIAIELQLSGSKAVGETESGPCRNKTAEGGGAVIVPCGQRAGARQDRAGSGQRTDGVVEAIEVQDCAGTDDNRAGRAGDVGG